MKVDLKKSRACPSKCSHPNVFDYPNVENIPADKRKIIDDFNGKDKVILYCGHCNTLWVEYRHDDNDYVTGSAWYFLIRVEDMQTMKEKWVI